MTHSGILGSSGQALTLDNGSLQLVHVLDVLLQSSRSHLGK